MDFGFVTLLLVTDFSGLTVGRQSEEMMSRPCAMQ
jgi:hypothetical protein